MPKKLCAPCIHTNVRAKYFVKYGYELSYKVLFLEFPFFSSPYMRMNRDCFMVPDYVICSIISPQDHF